MQEAGKIMQAKKCDRCGVLYEQYNVQNDSKKCNGIMRLNIDGTMKYFIHEATDLCPKCMTEFMTWLYAEKNKKEE